MELALSILFSLVAGSFGSMLIYRLNKNVSLLKPAFSMCPKCRHRLNPIDLIPLVSYLWQRGRCRYCKKPISLSYLGVELVFLGIVLVGYFLHTPLWKVIMYLVLSLIFFSDLAYHEIPYLFSGSLALTIFLQKDLVTLNLQNLLYVLIFAVFVKLLERFHYHKEVFGGGDILLFAILGLYLSFNNFVLFFYLSFVLGLLISGILLLLRRVTLKAYLPFAPFIIAAFCLVDVYGSLILSAYWKFFNV